MASNDEQIAIEITDDVAPDISIKLKQIAKDAKAAYSPVEKLKKALESLKNVSGLAKLQQALSKSNAELLKTQILENKLASAQSALALSKQRLSTEFERGRLASAKSEAQNLKTMASLDRLAAAESKAAAAVLSRASASDKANAAERLRQAGIANQAGFNSALGVSQPTKGAARSSAQVFIEEAKAQEELSRQAERLRASINPLYQAEKNLNSAISQANLLLKEGKITVSENAAAVGMAKARYDALAGAIKNVGNQGKLGRFQLLTLQYTINDVVASLASGASPLTILLQQGGQVTQAFGGLRGTFAKLFEFLTPLRLLIGGIATAVIGFAVALNSAENEQAKLNNALSITNNYAGLSSESYKKLTKNAANFANVSISSSKEVSLQLVQSGRFQAQQVEEITASTLKLAKFTGQSADDIIKSFIRAADAPAAYAQELFNSYGFISSAQLTQIKELEEQGDKTKALEILSRELYEYLGNKGSSNVAGLTGFFQELGKAISDAYDSFKQLASSLTSLTPDLERIAKIKTLLGPVKPGDGRIISFLKGETRESLIQELAFLESIQKVKEKQTVTDSENLKVQKEGADAAGRIAGKWSQVGDNVNRAKKEIAQFRNDLEKTLKADPTNKTALDLKSRQKQIEANITKRATPDAFRAGQREAKAEESRASALAKINTELDNQIERLNLLKPARDTQAKFDQIEERLIGKKIILNDSETKSIKDRLQTLAAANDVQLQSDRIYEEAINPLKLYNASLKASSDLLARGAINENQAAVATNKAIEAYTDSIDPLKESNRDLKDRAELYKLVGPAQEIQAQIQQKTNQFIREGLPNAKALAETLREKLETDQKSRLINQELNNIYSETIDKQDQLIDKTIATKQAYDAGYITLDQYGLRLNKIGLDSAQLFINNGQGNVFDALSLSLGKLVENYEGVLPGLTDSFQGFYESIENGFANSVGRAIVYSENLGDAVRDVAKSALSELISSLVKLGIQYVINKALETTVTTSALAAQTAASVTAAGVTAAAWAPAAAAVSLASFGANAVPAGTGVASVYGLAEALSSAGLAGFKEGGYTGGNIGTSEIAGVVHGKEFVVNSAATARNREALEAMNNGAKMVSANSSNVTNIGLSVNIENYGTDKDFEVTQMSANEYRIIARDVAEQVVNDKAANVVANDIRNPNGKVSKAMSQNTNTTRKR